MAYKQMVGLMDGRMSCERSDRWVDLRVFKNAN